MGDQAYAYRGHSYDSDEEWKNRNYGRNQVSRAVIYDSDGGKLSSIHGASPYGNTDTYMVETEIIEQIRATVGSEHSWYSSCLPKGIEQKYQRPSTPYRPPEVDHFLSGVQVEASRPSPHRYGHSNGHDRKNGYGNGYGDYRKGYDNGGGYSSSDEDDGEDGHSYNYQRLEPELVSNNGSYTWVKPGNGHGSKPGSLSMPTDSIEEAIEILKGRKKGEVGKHYGSSKPYGSSTEAVKPYGSGEAVKPNGYRSSIEAEKPYGSSTTEKPYGSSEAVKPYGSTLKPYESGEAVKPYGYGSDKAVKPYRSNTTVKPYGSGEAVKPYESSNTVKPYGLGEAVKPYGSTMKPYESSEAVKPYGYGSGEAVKPYGSGEAVKPYGSGEVVKPYGYGSSIEAEKPYGSSTIVKPEEPYVSKYQTPTYPQISTGSAQLVMDCYEAVKWYNAKVIRNRKGKIFDTVFD